MVWVDRLGAKLGFHETHSRNSKATYGVVIEEVTTRDEQGSIVNTGRKMTPSGNLNPDGPPTTHSTKGKDRVAFLQANVTRDATHYVNGTPIGSRDQFTVCWLIITCMASAVHLFYSHALLSWFIGTHIQYESSTNKPVHCL